MVLLGFGAINRCVAQLLQVSTSGAYIVGVIARGEVGEMCPVGASVIHSPEQLVAAAPDLVLEAASAEAVRQWACVRAELREALGGVVGECFC